MQSQLRKKACTQRTLGRARGTVTRSAENSTTQERHSFRICSVCLSFSVGVGDTCWCASVMKLLSAKLQIYAFSTWAVVVGFFPFEISAFWSKLSTTTRWLGVRTQQVSCISERCSLIRGSFMWLPRKRRYRPSKGGSQQSSNANEDDGVKLPAGRTANTNLSSIKTAFHARYCTLMTYSSSEETYKTVSR